MRRNAHIAPPKGGPSATVAARDERIEVLEAELAALSDNSDAEAAMLEASDAEKDGAGSESEELDLRD